MIELSHLTEAQRRAYVIADNKLAERAGWDRELLALEVGDLADLGVDLTTLGFDTAELDALLNASGPDPREEETRAAGEPGEPAGRRVDLRQAQGSLRRRHRRCGGGEAAGRRPTDADGHRPALPRRIRARLGATRRGAGLAKTKRTGKVRNDDRADWREAWVLFPGDVAYVWHAALHAGTVAQSLGVESFSIRSQIVWAKDRMVLSRGHYRWQHEPCWYAVRDGGTGHWSGDRTQTTLWQIANRDQDADTIHGTQKPVECMRRTMLNNSSPGQAVYDPFLGSGTSVIAAETSGRVCLGLELDPAYVDVIVQRWASFTGEEPILDGSGKTFTVVSAARARDHVGAD